MPLENCVIIQTPEIYFTPIIQEEKEVIYEDLDSKMPELPESEHTTPQ